MKLHSSQKSSPECLRKKNEKNKISRTFLGNLNDESYNSLFLSTKVHGNKNKIVITQHKTDLSNKPTKEI